MITETQKILSGYKQTEIGVIPANWDVKNLGDVCEKITTGKLNANAMVEGGEYRFYTCAKDYYRINRYAFDTEALLVSGNGANVGYVHYYKGKFNAYQRTYVLSDFSADIQYIKLFLDKNLQERIRVEVNAGNTPYITMGTLTEMQLAVPPVKAEQTAIATALSDADTLIQKLEKLIQKKKNIKQGAMQELLTGNRRLPGFSGKWKEKKISDICGNITTGKLNANVMVEGGEYRFYTCAKDYYQIDRYVFDTEALLVSGNGANVGYIHYYKGKFNAYQRTYVLYDFSADIQYVKLFMDRNLQERIRVEVNAGNTPYITMGTLTEMQIMIPPTKDEQTAIATVLSDMDTEMEALEQKLVKYKMLKQGMMQILLTGKVRLI